RTAVRGHAAGEGDLVVDRIGEHAVDQDLPGRVVRHGDLVGDDALVGDRRLRLELSRDLGVDDLALLHGLATAQAFLNVRLDLQDVHFRGPGPGGGVRAVDVVEDQKCGDGADHHRRNQNHRSARAHTDLVPWTNAIRWFGAAAK